LFNEGIKCGRFRRKGLVDNGRRSRAISCMVTGNRNNKIEHLKTRNIRKIVMVPGDKGGKYNEGNIFVF
jgi:hypothetical protein